MVASRKVSVGPIVSYEEACRCLEFDGVDFFVLLQPHPAFGNSDVIPREEVEKLLCNDLGGSFGLMASPEQSYRAIESAAIDLQASFVDFDWRFFPHNSFIDFLKSFDFPIRLSGCDVDYQGCVSSVEYRLELFESVGDYNAVVSIATDVKNPFEFLLYESGEFPDDLLLSDVVGFIKRMKNNVLINCNWEVGEYLSEFLFYISYDVTLLLYVGEQFATRLVPACVERSRVEETLSRLLV